MSRLSRKLVAVLLAIWLPLFSGSALAASLDMQMAQGSCHEASSEPTVSADMGEHHQHYGEMPTAQEERGSSCNACGVCHLACTGYLAMPGIAPVAVQISGQTNTPYLVSFHSVTFAPQSPPPLVRA